MDNPPLDIGGNNSVSEHPVGALTLVVTAVGFHSLIFVVSDMFLGQLERAIKKWESGAYDRRGEYVGPFSCDKVGKRSKQWATKIVALKPSNWEKIMAALDVEKSPQAGGNTDSEIAHIRCDLDDLVIASEDDEDSEEY